MTDQSPLSGPLNDFRLTLRLPVQWSDQDAFRHVNNTVSFRWFESSRIAYFDQEPLRSAMEVEGVAPILARASCNFRRQVNYPDTIVVGARTVRIGNKSILMEHAIYSERQDAIVSEGDSTVVIFDFNANSSRPVSESIRQLLHELDGLDGTPVDPTANP